MANNRENHLRRIVKDSCGAGMVALLPQQVQLQPGEMVQSARRSSLRRRISRRRAFSSKNALQENPGSEKRVLLGRIYLDQGMCKPLSRELRRANDLGYAPDQVIPVLSRAMVSGARVRH